jgi:hypothetical protein
VREDGGSKQRCRGFEEVSASGHGITMERARHAKDDIARGGASRLARGLCSAWRGLEERAIRKRRTTAGPSTSVAAATFAQDDSFFLKGREDNDKSSRGSFDFAALRSG